MRLRKASVAGIAVNPAVLAPRNTHFGRSGEHLPVTPYEIAFTLSDLRPEFFRHYAEWLLDMREFPDPDDEVEAQLRDLDWPSLGVLAEVEKEVFAVVMLCLGHEVLLDLEHGRDPMVRVEYVPNSVDEVQLRGRTIVMRGTAIPLRRESRISN
jgi:hypothetical protein